MGEVRHVGELGGLIPPPYPSVVCDVSCGFCYSVLFGAIIYCTHPTGGWPLTLNQEEKKQKNKQVSYHISRTMGDCYTLRAESTLNDFRSVSKSRAPA